MKKMKLFGIMVLLFSSIFLAGCSLKDENKVTIQTYLENEFTGPTEELRTILDQGLYSPELDVYLEDKYGDILADLDSMVRRNFVLVFLRDAHVNGYQLQPQSINIKKIEGTDNNVYDYEVLVVYNKGEETKTAIVSGKINLDDKGKITMIRKMDGLELFEELRN
ncbi:hypothetical protein FZW96_06745 [Bacillus sp. BGMRC 2118]|nr:hypothetical protein FZW96_06745 [Bacillus sp. BGMRC 2118]